MATTSNPAGALQSRKDYENNPRDQYKFWETELNAGLKRLENWHKDGDKIVNRYTDTRAGGEVGVGTTSSGAPAFRLNLFNSNITTVSSMLYGKLPRVDVSRNDNTGNDDVARVAAEMIQKILQLDIQENGEEYKSLFTSTLQDRLLPGLGCARVRYEVETEKTSLRVVQEGSEGVENAASATDMVKSEAAPLDYVYWADVTWGWARSYAKLPWIGFRSFLDKDAATTRFGKDKADKLTYQNMTPSSDKDNSDDPTDLNSPWQKAEIWELWDKVERKVVWISKGCPEVLDTRKDPLKLRGFFPNPPFFLANPTTKLYMPTPDYHLQQDLYNQIDILQTRIAIITEAVKVVGVYDGSDDGIKRMLQEGVENDLIPVDSWAVFGEKGGLKGVVDWMPIGEIADVLDKLRSLRDETIGLLQQTSGMADIMRGELNNSYEGVGQTELKAAYGSARIQALQDEFADFVADMMQLKAEVIARHFSPESIMKYSNMRFSPDVKHVPDAIALIKDPDQALCRVTIKPETMAQQDYARLQQERAAYLNGLSTFLQASTSLIQQDKRVVPFLMEMLKWGMAGFKGSQEIEGVLDQAIDTMKQQPEEPPEKNPEQVRGEQQMQLEKMRQQGKQQEQAAKHQQDMQLRAQDMQMDVQTRQAETNLEMQKNQQETQNELRIIAAKMQADVQTELATSEINAAQAEAGTRAQIEAEMVKSANKIREIQATKRADAGLKIIEKSIDAAENEKDRQAAAMPTEGDDS